MNRQVPEKIDAIAVVGNGRMAQHLIRYCELVGQPYKHWFRKPVNTSSLTSQSRLARFKHKLHSLLKTDQKQSLTDVVQSVDTVLLLIPDDQIESFIEQNPCLRGKTLVHFSGALHSEIAMGCHPLMTFGPDLYDLTQYQSIPFVADQLFDFKKVFPLFTNPVHHIKPEHKVRYHAMCVMAGNFSQMLWQATAKELQNMGLPAELMHPYLQQNTQNYLNDPKNALTGPFVRGDINTIAQHQQNLQAHPLGELYQAFYHMFQQPENVGQRSQL